MTNPFRRLWQIVGFPRLLIHHLRTISIQNGQNAENLASVRGLLENQVTGGGVVARGETVSYADVQREVGWLCDGVTRMMVEQRRNNDTVRTELAQVRQKLEAWPGEQQVRSLTRQVEATSAELVRLLHAGSRNAAQIAALDRSIQAQAQSFPSWIWTPEQATRVRQCLSLLQPMAIAGQHKVRVGRDHDGGYVMADDFTNIVGAFSLGIAEEISWDTAIAERGIPVLQYDFSVDAPPDLHALHEFHRLHVAAMPQPGSITIEEAVHSRFGGSEAPLLLKIDIEGDEWPVLEATPRHVLERFQQIVCEFHELGRLTEEGFGERARTVLARLAETHHVIHVHGNNCASFANVANVVVPAVLEVTYFRKSGAPAQESRETFPTVLDRPNEPGRADLYLGTFRFSDAAAI